MRTIIITAAMLLASLASTNLYSEELLYQYRTWAINDSKFGPIALFQQRLKDKLAECQSRQTLKPDGAFGKGTRKSIIAVTQCPQVINLLPQNSPARQGAITDVLWNILIPDHPAPNADERARALKLTFEATDYTKMQWNYCQNIPLYDPKNGKGVCYSNDKRAFITWGPHGATAGHGREVQAILSKFVADDPNGKSIFKQAFAQEADAVQRMMQMEKSSDVNKNGHLEVYLCSIWLDKSRRQAWRDGFKRLGQQKAVRTAYRDVYHASNFDGGKINKFYNVWQNSEFNLQVTEIDHAFFIDRSAHMGIESGPMIESLKKLKQAKGANWPPSPAEVRQHISLTVRPSNRRVDRLGRDVAFYVESITKQKLSASEREAWKARGRRNVVDVGVSDSRFLTSFQPGPSYSHPMPKGTTVATETCPIEVLNPKSPPR